MSKESDYEAMEKFNRAGLDHFADEYSSIQKAEGKYNNELGVTGLEEYAGVIQDDPLLALQGVRGARIFRQMADNDPVVGAMLFAIKGLIKQVNWKFMSASDKSEDVENADFLEECKDDMEAGFHDYIEEMLSFLEHGFSITELSYKKRIGYRSNELLASKYSDGRFGWKRLPPRAQTSILDGYWDFDREFNTLRGVFQYPFDGNVYYIPKERFLHLRTGLGKLNPQGRSILRNAYRPWYFKSRIENYEAIGVERDLAGIPTAYVPPDWMHSESPYYKQYKAVKQIVTRIKRDEQEGVVLPMLLDMNGNPLIKFELMASGGRRQYDTGAIINRKNDEILMTTLSDFIKLGQNSVGSHALAFSKTEIFTQALKGWVKIIEDGFNRQAIPRLMRLNGFNGEMPHLEAEGLDKIDGTIFLQNLKMVADAGYGYILDEQVEGKIRNLLDIPEPISDIGGNGFNPRATITSGLTDVKGNPIQSQQTMVEEEEEDQDEGKK